MGKRKRSEDKDYYHILRKVKKLEAKLRKRRRSSSSTLSEGDQSDEYGYNRYYDPDIPGDDVEDEGDYQSQTFSPELNYTDNTEQAPSMPAPRPAIPTPAAIPAPAATSAPPAASAPAAPSAQPAAMPASVTVPDMPAPGTPGMNTDAAHALPLTDDAVPPLDSEILQLLGDDPATEKNYGENLHKDIASRWSHILSNGLTKESLLELVKQYLPPKNCPNMAAPKLNPEIKAAFSEMNVKRDMYSQSKQNQLSNCLAAVGQVLNSALLPNSNVPQNIIKVLSDAGRLISDNHYKESLSRRYSALNSLNRNIRDTAKNTKIDEHLFGAALADHIKSSKAINKTGSEMKPAPLRSAYRIPPPQRGTLNSRGALPRTAAATEPRSTPAHSRPPPPQRNRRLESSRVRRPASTRRYNHSKKR